MSDSESVQETETSSNLSSVDRRIGVEGQGNRFVGDGGQTWDNQGINGSTAPISGGSSYNDTGDIFAPSFQFSGGNTNTWLSPENTSKALQQNPSTRADILAMLSGTGDSRTPEQWLYDDLNEGDTNSHFINIVKKAGGGEPASSIPGNFGGAAQTGALVTGGNVSAPVATGEDSIAVQVGPGGVNNMGDVAGPIITAPISGPALVAGGDQRFDGPAIIGNSAPVTINTSDPAVTTAAISGAGDQLARSLEFASKALEKVTTNANPAAAINSDAIKLAAGIALVFGAVLIWGRKAA